MAIYKCSWEVGPGTTRIKFNEWSERVLNPGSPDLKASALTTGPEWLGLKRVTTPCVLGNKLLNIQFAKYHIWNNKSEGFPNVVLSTETFNQSVRTEYSEALNARYTFQPLFALVTRRPYCPGKPKKALFYHAKPHSGNHGGEAWPGFWSPGTIWPPRDKSEWVSGDTNWMHSRHE